MVYRWNKGLIVLAFAVSCLVGCSPGPQSNLSPDGKTVALTNNDGLVLHDTTGSKADVKIKLDQATSPVFSPDSKYLAVCLPKSTILIDRTTQKRVVLPDIAPPYAWKPDGTELVGFRKFNATVIHIPSRSVVRSYKLPQVVEHAAWVGSGRDMVFSAQGSLYLVQNGKLLKHSTHGDIGALVVDSSRNRILWAELTAEKRDKKTPLIHSTIKQIAADFSGESTLLDSSSFDKLVAASGRAFAAGGLELSPDGKRLAVTFFIDASQPGVLEKYAELGGFDERAVSPERRKKLNALAKDMKLRTECISANLNDPLSKPSELFASNDTNIQLTPWSQDGNSIAIVDGEKVYLEHPSP